MKKTLFKIANVLCAFALFIAIHSAGVMCVGRYHQPKVPASLLEQDN